MNISVHFNNQPRLVTVEINDESCDDLLPPKMDSQFVRTQFLPENFLGGSHVVPQFAGAIEVLLYFPNAMTIFLNHYKRCF